MSHAKQSLFAEDAGTNAISILTSLTNTFVHLLMAEELPECLTRQNGSVSAWLLIDTYDCVGVVYSVANTKLGI